eukprot:jgi/Bigna1/87932/estExt_fgenesh1_pg.C_260039
MVDVLGIIDIPLDENVQNETNALLSTVTPQNPYTKTGDVCTGTEMSLNRVNLTDLTPSNMFTECKKSCLSTSGCIAFNVAYEVGISTEQQPTCYKYSEITGAQTFGSSFVGHLRLADLHNGAKSPLLGCYINTNQCAHSMKYNRVGDVCMGNELHKMDLSSTNAVEMEALCKDACDGQSSCTAFQVSYEALGRRRDPICWTYSEFVKSETFGELGLHNLQISHPDQEMAAGQSNLGCYLNHKMLC